MNIKIFSFFLVENDEIKNISLNVFHLGAREAFSNFG